MDSGTRALQYLGLDGEKSSVGIDVSKLGLYICLVAEKAEEYEKKKMLNRWLIDFPKYRNTNLTQSIQK